jgi:hypothetical protein
VVESSDSEGAPVAFCGEVWTDARGYATVALPHSAGQLHGSLDFDLRPFTPGVTAHVAAEMGDGRFTIATDEPHVKVAWRVSPPGPHENRQHDYLPKEET